jgi:RHH-type transcriptional regulator, rel operon repressor / antitoxin RelB
MLKTAKDARLEEINQSLVPSPRSQIHVRVKPSTRLRIDELARATRRSKSYVIEEALEQYLEVNEWQTKGIEEALAEADGPDAKWVNHQDLLAKLEAEIAD